MKRIDYLKITEKKVETILYDCRGEFQEYPLWGAPAAGRQPPERLLDSYNEITAIRPYYKRMVPPPPKGAPAADLELILIT
jgi:hypothetical protein